MERDFLFEAFLLFFCYVFLLRLPSQRYKDLYRHYPDRYRTRHPSRHRRSLPDADSNSTGNCRKRRRSYRCRCPAGSDYKCASSCRTDSICRRCPRRHRKRRRSHPRRRLPGRCSAPSGNCRRDSDGRDSEGSCRGCRRCRCRDRKSIRFRPNRRDTAKD